MERKLSPELPHGFITFNRKHINILALFLDQVYCKFQPNTTLPQRTSNISLQKKWKAINYLELAQSRLKILSQLKENTHQKQNPATISFIFKEMITQKSQLITMLIFAIPKDMSLSFQLSNRPGNCYTVLVQIQFIPATPGYNLPSPYSSNDIDYILLLS